MDENEELDLDSLQAQINMSMSFAQDLVSSWVEPRKVGTSSRSRDLEKELKEHMRRPARLGVGAPVQDTSTLFSKAARLKGQLRDKGKLKRSEEVLNQSDSDDPDESRTGMIKKKTKLDPFSARSRTLTTHLLGTVDALTKRANGGIKQSHDTPQSISTAKLDVTLEEGSDTMAATPRPPNKVIHSTISREILGNVKAQEVAASNPHPIVTSPSKPSILNLDGPPLSEDEGQIYEDGTGRKKKRKRRKKKKNRLKSMD